MVIRLRTNGTIDTTFSGDGLAIADQDTFEGGAGLDCPAEQEFVLNNIEDGDSGLFQFNSDGTVDQSFGLQW